MELTLHVNDKLKLYSKTFLSSHHKEIINLLYQPIIGIEATSLYFSMWSFKNIEKGELIISHRQLLTFFNWDLKKLVSVRNKLESIGLLNVFYHNVEGYYVYELKQPLNAKQFFQDSNLNIHLLYIVGDNMYEYLERKFIVKSLDKSLINITKNFEDVFDVVKDIPKMPCETEYVTSSINNFSLPLNYNFDFELFSILVSRGFVNTDKMTQNIKEAIIKEAALYNFDAQMMSEIVLESISNNEIDVDKLHNVARDYYKRLGVNKSYNEEIKPAMTEKQFSEYINKKRLTQKEKALKAYKTKTPLEWLRILQNNTEVPNSFLDVVKVLFDEYKLPSEVINVLIEFVRIRNDGRLPLEYTKTVASNWAFKHIKTAEEAMEYIEKITDKEKEYAKRGEIAPTYVKPKRVVESPDWMKDHQEYRRNSQNDSIEVVDFNELNKLLEACK